LIKLFSITAQHRNNGTNGTDGDIVVEWQEEDGNVRSVRKMKALTVDMETVTVIGKGRCIKCMKLIVKYFS
jgi:hypothetical protein